MNAKECGEVFGVELEDGWQTVIPVPSESDSDGGVIVVSVDGVIRAISISTDQWEMDNGIAVGDRLSDASEGLGEPIQEYSSGEEDSTVMRVYELENDYTITFTANTDNVLISVGVSWPTGETEKPSVGIKTLVGRGTGDSHIEAFMSPREYLYITHGGSGEFKVTLQTAYEENGKMFEDSFVMVDRIGKYEGLIFTPSPYGVAYDVVADGEWSIWSYSYAYATIFTEETFFGGTGDFATLYLNPEVTQISGTWRVTYEGDGNFLLRLNSFYADMSGQDALIDVNGRYSGEVQVDDNMLRYTVGEEEKLIPVAFEIKAEGAWTLEKME